VEQVGSEWHLWPKAAISFTADLTSTAGSDKIAIIYYINISHKQPKFGNLNTTTAAITTTTYFC